MNPYRERLPSTLLLSNQTNARKKTPQHCPNLLNRADAQIPDAQNFQILAIRKLPYPADSGPAEPIIRTSGQA